ncbi:phage tail protein [Acinetobacter baumannii]|uniref:TipJ family phage tail tip protein n=8 Tax=Acinetobacter baumannii TaxID=470 RepID=UPI00313A7B53
MAIVKGAKKGKGEARKPVVAPDSAQSKTYIKILYGLGEGEIEGLANGNQSIFLEGTPLQDANGNLNYSNVKLDFRKGTNDQDYIEGFPSVESETAVDVELKSGAPWVRAFNNIDLDAVRIRLKWGPLRQQDSSTGDVSGITIEYAIDIQTDGGAWTEVLKTKISDKTSANYERAHRIDLPKADSGWLIRVRRITPNSTSEFVSDKMYVEAFTEVVDAKLRYPNTALLGLQYDAETFGNVAKLAVDLKGRLLLVPTNYSPQTRQYTGIWDGTFKRAYTNNPAWIYYDLCTNDRYGLGNRLTPFMIDKWSLYRLAQYCDQSVSDGLGGQEPRFTCNVYIQNAEDAFSILMKLAGVFRAIAFWDGTSIICDADIPQDTYFTYTRANVVGGVFEYSGTRARDRHNVVKVAWDNPANHYKTEYEFVRDENAIAESGQVRILELDAWGCTSRGQAQRAGHWALKSEQKETRTVSFKVGLDGHIPLPGRVIEIADELFAGRANGGRVSKISADLKSITIDRDDVIAKAGDRLVINGENGKAQTRIVQSISGRVITVTLPFDENSIAVQNVWVLDAQDLATMKFRVISISQEEKHQFSITALQYNPQKFDEIDNGAFFEDAPISIINPSIQEPVKDVLITTESRVDQGINITTMIVSWMQAKGAVKYLVEWRKDDGSWIRLPQTGNNSVEVPGVYSGQYQARVTAISAFEIASLPVTSSLTEITGKQGLPPKIAFIRATGILFGMKLDWGFPPTGAKDTAYTEIEVSPDGINNIAQLGLFAYPTTTTTIQGLQPNLRQFYRGRLIDRIGNVGPWSEWVNGTTTADPEAVLDLISGHINESDLAQELQGKIENSVDVSEAAQAAANNAQAVASSAQTAANNAQAVASEAKTAASSAQSAATTAQTQASSAQKIANDASVIATNAKNTADQAAEDASSAITAAAEAKTTATNANTTATNAQTTANNASSAASKVASDLTTSTNQLNKKIADETDARTAAISKLNDGLTTETSQRKSEDAALLNNIETYKSSTNGTLSSLQTQINTNATNTSANTSKITSLDSRLTTNEGKTADAINAAATAQQVANTAVTNAAAAASAVTSLKSELSTGKGINNIIAPFSDPQELSPYIIGASRTVALVNSPMRINGKAYDVTFNAVAGSIYFGSSSVSTVNTAAAGVVSGGKRYMLSAYLKNIDPTKQAEVYFTLHWFKRTSEGAYSATQTVLINQATNTTRVTPSNEGGTVSCKAVAAPPDAVAFVVICSGNSVYNVAGSRILIDMLMLEEVVGVDVPASTWTAGPADLSAIKSALDANASAISNLKTRVTNAEGVITSQGNSITQLNNSVTSINSELTKKADATTLNALTNRVSTAEGTITSQGNSITSLRNDLNATNDKVASKADSSALNSLDSKVSEIDGRVTSNTSAVTALQGRVTTVENGLLTKADASALNNYYTKTEADSATSGAIDKFNSQLTIGGVNVVANSEAPRTSTAATNREYLLYERSAELKAFYDENLEKPITISFEMSVPVAGPVQVYSSNGSAHQFVTSVNAIIVNQFAKYSVTVSPKAHTASTTVSTIEFYGTYGTGRIPTIRKLQIEAGTKATAWSPSPRDTKAAIDANASAIQTTQTKVDNIDGRLTTATDSITSLNSRMSTAEGNINSTNTAVGGLSTRMATAEGKITNQSDSIASLQNSVTSINGTLANKADSSAVNNLTSRVETAEGKISSQSGQITSLSNSLDLTNSNLNDVNVLARLLSLGKPLRDDPTFKLGMGGLAPYALQSGSTLTRQAVSADNPTESTYEVLLRATTTLGSGWYPNNPTVLGGPNKAFLVKQVIKMPTGQRVYPYNNPLGTGGFVRMLGNAEGTGKFETYYSIIQCGPDASKSIQGHFRVINSTNPPVPTTSNPVDVILASYEVFDVTAVNDTIPKAYSDAISANANAINSLSNSVTQQGNTITSHSNSITSLNNSITSINSSLTNKADASALNNLSNRVTAAEGNITSQGNSITSLNNTLTNNDLSNLVLNPDFIDPKNGWTSGVIVDATDAAPNPPSLKALKLNNRDSYYGPFVKCNVGDMFYVSAWFATPNTSATASAVLGFNTRNSAGTYTWYSVAIKSTDKNAWGMVEGYFTVPNGMVDIRPWLQVSIAASEAAGQQWHVTNIQVRNITGNKKLATDLQATSSALSTLDSKVTNIDGRVTSASNNIVSLNNSVTNINATLAQKADATALNSLSNRVTNAEGNITSQGNSITSLNNTLTNNDLSNLVLNPDFIDPKNGWTSGVIVDATDAAPNPPSLKALKLNNRDSYYGPFVKCNVGDMFYVSAWFATPNTSATASAVLGFNTRNSAGTYTWYSVAIKSTDKNAWGMVEGYFTVPNGMVDIRPWLQVSIAASEAAGQQWHVTNIQVRNITGNKKLATDLQATSSALSTLDSKVTNIDGRVTSASNNIVSLNNSVTNINATLAQKADATALNSLSNRVTNAEGNITSQGNSITSLNNTLTNNDLSNLVLNPDFIDPKNGWTSGVIVDATDAAPNPPSLKALKLNNRDSYYGPFVKCNVGDMFYVSAWFATPNTSATASAVLGFNTRNSAGTYTWYSVAIKSTDKNAWGMVEGYFTVPNGMVDIRPWLQVSIAASEAAGQQWHVTNIQVRNITGNKKLATDLQATSSALSTLDSKVTNIDGRVTSASNNIVSLNNSVTNINATLAQKADATALNSLSNRVTNAEGNITSQGNSITSLNNTLTNNDLSNLVLNPDFIDPKNGWTSGVIVDATDAAPNPPSLKALKLNNRDSYYGPFVKCNVGDMFYVSAWFATPNTSATASAVLGFNTRNSAGTYTWYSVAIKSTDKNAWGMVEGYFTVPNGMVDIRPWLQVSIAASEAAGQQWHVTNIQVRNITGNKKLATDLQATSSALSTLDSKVTNIDGRVTSASNNIVSLNNSVTNINATLAQKADATALNSLSNRVTNAEGNITSQGNSITSLNNTLTNNDLSNLVLNPDFIDPKNGWTSGVIVDATDAAPNPPSLKALKLNNRDSYYGPFVKCNVGDMFYVSAWFATPNTSATASAVLGFNTRNSAGTYTWYSVAIKSTDKNAWGMVEGYFTVPNGMVDIRPWLQVSIAASEAAGQQWHVTNIQVRNITGNKKLATDLQATSSALSTLDSKVTNIDGRVTSASNNIVSLNNSVTNINATLAQKADATALNSLSNRVTNAEGNITSQGNSITSLNNTLTNNDLSNLVLNPDFIDPKNGWTSGVIVDATDAAPNPPSLKALKLNNRDSYYGPFVKCNVGDMFYVSAWFATPNTSATASAVLGFNTRNSAGTYTWYSVAIKSTDKNAWGMVEGYFTVPNGMVDIRPWLQVSIAASEAAGQQWHVTNIQVRNITGNKKLATDLQATSSALSTLDSKVTNIDGRVTSASNNIVSLNNSITNINSTLATKADSSALTNLASRVTATEGAITSHGSSITSLNASVNGLLKDVSVSDTRSTNQPPSWYWSNYPLRIVREFKQASVLGLTGMGTYVSLETYVYWTDASGGPIIQIARGTDSKLTAERRSASTAAWSTWTQDIKAISDGLANKAEASALSSLDSKVSVIDGKVSTQASSITTLQTTVGGNTASIQSQQQSIDGLKARATLKLQSGNLVGGVGIENDSKTVDFIIQANKFAIGAPSTVSGSVTPKYAFVYQSTATTLPNGTVIPAGLYLDSASISYINANKIYADSLSAISANLGTFTSLADQSKPNGARTVISGERIEVYDENNVMRVRIGRW